MSNESDPSGVRELLRLPDPSPLKKRRLAGWKYHKPGCHCRPCESRRRKAQAELGGDGVGGALVGPSEAPVPKPEKVIEADRPLHLVKSKDGRERIVEWVSLRHLEPDMTNTEAARRMGISRGYLQYLIRRAVAQGWLQFDNPLDRIDFEIVPKVIKNLNKFLDDGDKQTTLETAKGTLFRTYQEAKENGEAIQTVLALKIEQPDGKEIKVVSGQIVGRPKRRDEVEDE